MMTDSRIALKGARNPFASYDLDPARGTPGPIGSRPRRPEGTQGLAAWFASRMVPRYH